MVEYPSVDKIVEFNLLALSILPAKKSDSPKVLSMIKILEVLKSCSEFHGTVFDKAVVLLKGLIQSHAFASGNRRTAFIATKYFLTINNSRFGVEDKPENAKVLLGIRENYYLHDEIKEWIMDGKIREFKR